MPAGYGPRPRTYPRPIKEAGLKQIDHLITTHYHGDHFGGMAEVAAKIPVREFIDHGPSVEASGDNFVKNIYPPLYANAKHTVVKPGDRIAVAGLEWRIVESAGQPLTSSLPGAGKANPYCAAFKPADPDATENAQSAAVTSPTEDFVPFTWVTYRKQGVRPDVPDKQLGRSISGSFRITASPVSNVAVLAHAIEPR